jgi:Ca-activated chloride channel homolog
MKRISIVLLSIMLMAVLVISGCSSSMTTTQPAQTAPAVPSYTQPQAPQTTMAAPTYRPPAPATSAAAATRLPMPTTAPSMSRPVTVPPAQVPVNPPAITVRPPTTGGGGGGGAGGPQPPATSSGSVNQPLNSDRNATIGLSAGGAKDVQNFRENIRNSYLPLPTDITYEGLFYDYYFDSGEAEPTSKLYSPSYSFAVSRDPISHQAEYYLSVGLNSGMKASDFERKKLNLVIVLDNSGSMGDNYNQYYYDRFGNQVDAYAEEGLDRRNKIRSATESVVSILDQLKSDDRFAVVTFNTNAYLEKPMGLVSRADMRDIKNHVLDIIAGGSTNLDAGMRMATQQFNNLYELNSYEYENRIMVLTDAQPNTGDVSSAGLMNMVSNNAANRLYTTFIGIGVDFNSQLIESISKTKGANYYSVHSPREFRGRVNEQFDYMVTPLIFNLQLNFESRGWRIDKVFGSPEADAASGSLMKINTLFASKSDESGAVKGGLVLLKLRQTSSSSEDRVYLKTSYEDRNGRLDGDTQTIYLEAQKPEYFANSGIRKGIVLSRYAALIKNWLIDERQHMGYSQPWQASVREDCGIILPNDYSGQWERQSLNLKVSAPYRTLFKDFSRYFGSEMDGIKDGSLGQELDIINLLSRY